jgi:ethanolamine ammonia-lyase large subunit
MFFLSFMLVLKLRKTSFKKTCTKPTIRNITYQFEDLKTLMAKATPLRSGDELAGVAAQNATERVAAQMALADVPLKTKFLCNE